MLNVFTAVKFNFENANWFLFFFWEWSDWHLGSGIWADALIWSSTLLSKWLIWLHSVVWGVSWFVLTERIRGIWVLWTLLQGLGSS
jgi:hypothetical protein